MKKELPTVHWVYAEVEESLERLIEASFRLYLARMLSMQETLGEWLPFSGEQECTSK